MRRKVALGLGITTVAVAIFFAVGFGRLFMHRFTDQNYDGRCSHGQSRVTDGKKRVEFSAECSLWPSEILIRSSDRLVNFASELSIEPDVIFFEGSGPACARRATRVVVCEGDVDAGETFNGWIDLGSNACTARLTLDVLGGGCSDIARECDDIGLSDTLRLDTPAGCAT